MRALGLSDTIFYNLRDAYINAVSVLEGPADPARMVAQVEGVIEAAPGWRERSFRIGVWSFATEPRAVDINNHVFIARHPTATTPADLARFVDRMRRSRFEVSAPAWRVIVLNPAGTPPAEPGGPPPLSGIYMQARHGLADAARALQAMAPMAGFAPEPRHKEIAAGLPSVSFDDLPIDINIHDSGMLTRSIARSRIPKSGDPAASIAHAAAAAVRDPALYPDVGTLTGNIACTRLVKRRGAERGVGNHVKLETLGGDDRPVARSPIPGLERAQTLPIMQYLVAAVPGALARRMMGIWYKSFDAIGTIIPMPPRLALAGQRVTAMFGSPPLWGPVPLVLQGFVMRDHWHLVAFPGRGFGGNETALMDRLEHEMTGETADGRGAGAALQLAGRI